jgi:thymidylate synthase
MGNIDKQYQRLLSDIIENGVDKKDRTGTGTISVFGRQIRHNMSEGFPLLTTKKMAVKTMMTELKWFLKGDTNIKYLVDNNCHIWDGDAYKAFKSTFSPMPGIQSSLPSQDEFINKIKTNNEFAQKWGELGPIYGNQWREWGSKYDTNYILGTRKRVKPGIDQIVKLIDNLKNNPDSRRLMVSAWNVDEIDNVVLPPCHYGFQVYTEELSFDERVKYWVSSIGKSLSYAKRMTDIDLDERGVPKRKLSLMWNQRSCDTFLGIPFNISSYGTLLVLISKEVNMVPGELIGNLGDVHLYKNHIEQAKEQILREPYNLPTIEFSNVDLLGGEWDYKLNDYEYHPTIKAPLSN